ncbi:lipase family protein [Taibaiella soli]|uniref:Lipase family protein n=1 Tax=Taibaiella soli TaxID=1649169 RepID=A0A2W2AWE9_9BACT|nr:lipase family protein [Taibaiella soli]PZF72294.1 lipase family protein [Taibaiella soli]
MKLLKSLFTFCLCFYLFTFSKNVSGSVLKAGFDIEEYKELLKVSARQLDTPWKMKIPDPQYFQWTYRSPVNGLDNRWDLWIHKSEKVAVLSVRGTTAHMVSWLENFYAAMVPAKGDLQLSNTQKFHYELADNPKAAVHVGWLIGMASICQTMIPKVDSCYKAGIHDFIIMGHSQGGAIAFLLRSYFDYLRRTKQLPQDITIKTYCSAAPKPGNLYYAYDYDHLTRSGWGFTVLNTEDWVPETPLTLQTVHDFNTVNPFTDAQKLIKKQKFPVNLVFNIGYKRLRNPGYKLLRRYKKYLGDMMYKQAIKTMTEMQKPPFYNSFCYMPAGTIIVLKADAEYFRHFPDSKTNVFAHHFMDPYLYLAERYVP